MPKASYHETIRGKDCIWIQFVGYVEAVPAKDVKPGMHRIYNSGSSAEFVSAEPSGKRIKFVVRCEDGKEYETFSRANTLIPAYWPKIKTAVNQ